MGLIPQDTILQRSLLPFLTAVAVFVVISAFRWPEVTFAFFLAAPTLKGGIESWALNLTAFSLILALFGFLRSGRKGMRYTSTTPDFLLALFLAALLVGIAWSPHQSLGWVKVIRFLLLVVVPYFIARFFLHDRETIQRFLKTLILIALWLSVTFAALAVIEQGRELGRVTFFGANPIPTASLIMIAVVAAVIGLSEGIFTGKWKYIALAGLPLLSYGLILTGSRGPVFALFEALLLYAFCIFKRRPIRAAAIIGGGLALTFIIFFSGILPPDIASRYSQLSRQGTQSVRERIEIYGVVFKAVLGSPIPTHTLPSSHPWYAADIHPGNPWIGMGTGGIGIAENMFLEIFAHIGLFGVAIFLFYLGAVGRSVFRFFKNTHKDARISGIAVTVLMISVALFFDKQFSYALDSYKDFFVFVGILINVVANSARVSRRRGAGDVAIIHNIAAPYKNRLFTALTKELNASFTVLFLAATEARRSWDTSKDRMQFPHEMLSEKTLEAQNKYALSLKLLRRLHALKPRIVVIWGYDHLAFWVAFAWAKLSGSGVVLAVESHKDDKPRTFWKEMLKRFLVSRIDAALVAGSRHRAYVEELGLAPQKIFVMKGVGGVDSDLFKEVVTRHRSEREALRAAFGLPHRNVLFVGRLAPEKNLFFLLRAFHQFQRAGGDWGLILVGDGPEEKKLKAFVEAHGIRRVVFPGFLEGAELAKYYAVADVFVLPSSSEPWGLVVEEAMSAGLPVCVSTRCGCVPDLVRDGVNGFSFDPGNEEALIALMRNFATNMYDRDAMSRASLTIMEEYGTEASARIVGKAIASVFAKRV